MRRHDHMSSPQELAALLGSEAPIVGLSFDNETLKDGRLSGLSFADCRFSDCHFDYAEISDCRFINCRFDGCDFSETVFNNCQFMEDETGTVWRYCNLSKSAFNTCNLSLNRFVGCLAYELQMRECSALGASFDLSVHREIAGRTMRGGMAVEKCKLQYAQFASGDFAESRFEGSDLRDTSFAGCDLSYASLRGSALHNADFAGATLDGANLAHASFDALDIFSTRSHHGTVVTRDQHEAILASIGILTED